MNEAPIHFPFMFLGVLLLLLGGGFLIMEIVKGFYVISLKNNYKQKGSSTETKRVKGNHTPFTLNMVIL